MNVDWHVGIGVTASIIMLGLIVPYAKSIAMGTTRPSIVSWAGWTLLFAIDTAAQASKDIDWSLVIPLLGTLSTAIITIVSLKNGHTTWTTIDKVSVSLGTLAILLWAVTNEPLIALMLSTLADLFVTVPTIVKTYQTPESEPASLWALYTFAAFLLVIATQNLTIYNLLVPVYTVLGSGIIAALALRGHGQSVK